MRIFSCRSRFFHDSLSPYFFSSRFPPLLLLYSSGRFKIETEEFPPPPDPSRQFTSRLFFSVFERVVDDEFFRVARSLDLSSAFCIFFYFGRTFGRPLFDAASPDCRSMTACFFPFFALTPFFNRVLLNILMREIPPFSFLFSSLLLFPSFFLAVSQSFLPAPLIPRLLRATHTSSLNTM